MQRIGSAVGIAVVGSVLFSGIAAADITSGAEVPQAFTDAAAWAIGVSVALSVVAFVLVFALPKRVSSGHAPAGGAAPVVAAK